MSSPQTDAYNTIQNLSKEFPAHVIQTKPGSKPGATQFKPATKYVSHGSVTKRLNEVCPGWSSRVVEWHTFIDGKGELRCAGVTLEVTVPGAGSHQEFGKAATPRNFGDDAKNAMSDALKRCAMRFGVALDLWEDMDEGDEDADYSVTNGVIGGAPKDTDPGPAPRSQPQHDGRWGQRAQQPPAPRPQPQPRPDAPQGAPGGDPADEALLAKVNDDLADPGTRVKYAHNYLAKAKNVAELNQRDAKLASIPDEDRKKLYRHHHNRLAAAFTPTTPPPASFAG